jgi:regulator of sigma E protease
MRSIIEKSPNKNLIMTVERNGEKVALSVTPSLSDQKDMFGDSVGRIGVAPSGTGVKLGITGAIWEGFRFTGYLTKLVVMTLVKLVRGEISAKALSGPITIVQASGESLKAGLFSFIFLLSYISINLAIINLLPIPVLDGGHLLLFAIEGITGKPVEGKPREVAQQIGLFILIMLMLFAFYNDIVRIFKG